MLHSKLLAEESLQLWIYLYGAMCTLFASLAGIRQFDKNKQHDVARDINLAGMGYDPRRECDAPDEPPVDRYVRDAPLTDYNHRRQPPRGRREDFQID